MMEERLAMCRLILFVVVAVLRRKKKKPYLFFSLANSCKLMDNNMDFYIQ